MSFPQVANKYAESACFGAADVLAQRRLAGTAPTFHPPETVIFCFQPDLLRYAARRWRGKRTRAFFGQFFLLRKTGGRVGVVGEFGVGAPATAVLLEDFIAYGVRRFISIGIAGGLQDYLRAGDLVLAERAIRDEGTSHHYLPPAPYVAADAGLTDRLQAALNGRTLTHRRGTVWSLDAPYRETRREVDQHRSDGVLAVDMEAAALLAVAHCRGVQAAAAFAIGDTFAGDGWQLAFDATRAQRGIEALCDAALDIAQ